VTFEDWVKKQGLKPTKAQWAFIVAYDKAVNRHRTSGLLWWQGHASGKSTLLRWLEDYWRQQAPSSYSAVPTGP
jgi:hypothetical protein